MGKLFQIEGPMKEKCEQAIKQNWTDNNNIVFYVLFLQSGAHSPSIKQSIKQSKQTSANIHMHTHPQAQRARDRRTERERESIGQLEEERFQRWFKMWEISLKLVHKKSPHWGFCYWEQDGLKVDHCRGPQSCQSVGVIATPCQPRMPYRCRTPFSKSHVKVWFIGHDAHHFVWKVMNQGCRHLQSKHSGSRQSHIWPTHRLGRRNCWWGFMHMIHHDQWIRLWHVICWMVFDTDMAFMVDRVLLSREQNFSAHSTPVRDSRD